MTVGAGINFGLLFDILGTIVGLTLGLMVLKVVVLYLLGVSFVLLAFAVSSAAIPVDLADRMLLIVALSMLLTPALFILFDRVILPRYANQEEREMDDIAEKSNVIIAGHGRVGGVVGRFLRGGSMSPTVIDFSSKQLEMLKVFKVQAYFGDATRPDLLHAAGIAEAKLFIVAIDGRDQITELTKYVHHHYPDVHIVAPANDRTHVYDLWAAGCRDSIRDTYDSSLRMGRSAAEALGYSHDQAERMIDI